MERPELPSHFPLSFALATRWCEEDAHGILNNAVYLTLMEEARYAQLAPMGALEASRFPFVLAQANVRWVRPGLGGARVTVELATTHLGTTSFTQAYRIRGAESGDDWCLAEARLVCVDREGRPTPISDALRAALGPSVVSPPAGNGQD